MKRTSATIAAWFFLACALSGIPAISFADTSIKGKSDCPAGSSTADPSGAQTFGATADAAAAINSYVYRAESCASACYNENLSVSVGVSLSGPTVTVTVQGKNQCGSTPVSQPLKATPPRGCAAGQTQPQITLEVPEVSLLGTTYLKQQTIGPKSRCYEAVAAATATLTKGGISGMSSNPAAIQTNFDSLNSLSSQAPVVSSGTTIAGNDQLISALTSSGINASDAQKLASDPASAQALINAYSTGNKNTIQDTVQDAASKAGINLNSAIYDNISSLSDTKIATAQTALTPLADSSGTAIPNDTFIQDTGASQYVPGKGGSNAGMISQAEQQYNLPPGLLGNMCNSESRCNPNACFQNNPNSACGMYQYIPSTWTGVTTQMCAQGVASVASYCVNGSIPLNYRLDANVSTQVAGYNISQNLAQYGPLIAQTGINPSTAAYIMNGLGTPTASKFFQAYISNPNMSTADFLYQTQPSLAANILANNGHLYAGQTLQGTVNQFAANLGAPGSVSSGGGVGGAGGSYVGPLGSITGGSYAVDPTLSGAGVMSPFANVSGLYSNPTAAQGSYNGSYVPSSNSYSQTPTYQPTQYAPTAVVQTPVTVAPSTPPAVAQIIVQPHSATKGSQLIVAWTSAGTDTSSPCRVLENGSATLATLNEGTLTVNASTTGNISFTLSCKSRSAGASVTSSDSAVIH